MSQNCVTWSSLIILLFCPFLSEIYPRLTGQRGYWITMCPQRSASNKSLYCTQHILAGTESKVCQIISLFGANPRQSKDSKESVFSLAKGRKVANTTWSWSDRRKTVGAEEVLGHCAPPPPLFCCFPFWLEIGLLGCQTPESSINLTDICADYCGV